MREVLFKAKLKDWKTNPQQNKWVEGYYLSRKETTYCFTEDYERNPVKTLHYIAVDSMTDWGLPNKFRCYEIDPDTLCQYTYQNDVNGNKIWENDICVDKEEEITYLVTYSEEWSKFELTEYGMIGQLMEYGWDETAGGFGEVSCEGFINYLKLSEWFIAVGNKFDNPELLKGEEISRYEIIRS